MSSSIDCSDRTRSVSSPLRANRSATTTIGGMAIEGTSSLLERAQGGRPAGAGPERRRARGYSATWPNMVARKSAATPLTFWIRSVMTTPGRAVSSSMLSTVEVAG